MGLITKERAASLSRHIQEQQRSLKHEEKRLQRLYCGTSTTLEQRKELSVIARRRIHYSVLAMNLEGFKVSNVAGMAEQLQKVYPELAGPL